MKKTSIEKIAHLVPCSDSWLNQNENDLIFQDIPVEVAEKIRKSQILLNSPNAGWIIARSYAKAGCMPPAWFKEPTVRKTIKFLMGKGVDPVIMNAIALCNEIESSARNLIHALLLNVECDYKEISQITGISRDVICAHEELFFNIRDRRDEHTYLSGIVYPKGRIDELRPNYFDAANNRELLLRVGFNRSSKQTAFIARLQMDSPYALGNNSEKKDKICRDMLEQATMAIEMGVINNARHPLGLVIKQSTDNAAQQVRDEDFSIMKGIGNSILDDLTKLEKENYSSYGSDISQDFPFLTNKE